MAHAGAPGPERRALELLAEAGLAALAPRLAPDGELPSDRRAVRDLEAAAAQLASELGGARTAVLGLGPGACLAFLQACASRSLAAGVGLGGSLVRAELAADRPSQPLELALNLSAPFLSIFGEGDPAAAPDEPERARRTASQFALPWDIVVAPGAGGSLSELRVDRPAVVGAWRTALAFLRERLDTEDDA